MTQCDLAGRSQKQQLIMSIDFTLHYLDKYNNIGYWILKSICASGTVCDQNNMPPAITLRIRDILLDYYVNQNSLHQKVFIIKPLQDISNYCAIVRFHYQLILHNHIKFGTHIPHLTRILKPRLCQEGLIK